MLKYRQVKKTTTRKELKKLINELIKSIEELQEINKKLAEIRKPDSEYIKEKVNEIFPAEKWEAKRKNYLNEINNILSTF